MNNHPNWRPPFSQLFCATIAWEKVISDYQSGMPPKQLADKYGCSKSTVYIKINEAGVKKISAKERNRMSSPIERKINCKAPTDQVISDYESGMSLKELGKKYGMTLYKVRKRLKEAGVKKITAKERNMMKLPMGQIISDYESGMATRKLADKYGVGDHTIRSRLKEAGVRKISAKERNRMNSPTDQIKSDYLSGMTSVEVGEKYGVHDSTIRSRLREAGVQLRKRGFGGMSRLKKETIYGRRNKKYKAKNVSVAHIISEYQSGMSATELGEKYGNNAFIMQLID